MDPDTEDLQLVYEITRGPKHGSVENKLQPGRAAVTFTQGGHLENQEMGGIYSNTTLPTSLIFLTSTSSFSPLSSLFANK